MLNENIKITIFHTNDMHGRLKAIARLSSYSRRCRKEAEAEGRLVFFWDAGDAADRRLRLCSLTKGAAFSPILNAMEYSLQTMGNAISLTYGPQAMQAVAARAKFPILAANCRDGDGPLTAGLEEHVIYPISNLVKMGVLGLTAPWGNFYELFGLHFPDFCDLAIDKITTMRHQGVGLIVVLSHLGLEDDRRLAEVVPGIDLIIGAHSHDRLPNGEIQNGVLIVQTGDYAQALGRVDLTLDAETGQVLAQTALLLDVPEVEPPDPAVLAAIAAAEAEVAEIMARPIGTLLSELSLDHYAECGIGDLAADVLRERMAADAAIVASGQFRTSIPAGTIAFGQLDGACFSTANPGLTEVRGMQVVNALERGLDPKINQQEPPSYRGTPVGIPQISGLQVWYDEEAEVGQRVQQVCVNGEPIDPNRIYRLAHTDAETMSEIGYLVLEEGQNTQYEVPTILREAIEAYLKERSPVALPGKDRWIPTRIEH